MRKGVLLLLQYAHSDIIWQIVSRQHTNLTPAQLEEFESTFRYFDKDASNTLTVPELGAALASLGIVYTEDDIEQIHFQLSQNFGSVSYVRETDVGTASFASLLTSSLPSPHNQDAFLTFLREISEDSTSPDQLLEAFQGLASDKARPSLLKVSWLSSR